MEEEKLELLDERFEYPISSNFRTFKLWVFQCTIFLWRKMNEPKFCVQMLWREETPHFLRVPYVTDLYRANLSYSACFKSVFRIHNETGNIWSHLLCFLTLVVGWIYLISVYFPQFHVTSKIMLCVYLFGSGDVLLCSAIFHTFLCHSKDSYCRFSKLDYTGISLTILGSQWALMEFTFYCDQTPRIVFEGFSLSFFFVFGASLDFQNIFWIKLISFTSCFLNGTIQTPAQ